MVEDESPWRGVVELLGPGPKAGAKGEVGMRWKSGEMIR